MALSRVKVWVNAEILEATDLNAEFNNVINNPVSLISPLTANLDCNGKSLTSAVLPSAKVTTAILDTNGNELLKVTATASAVNEVTLANAATTGSPALSATGGDTNINVNIVPKGTGRVQDNAVNLVTVSSTDTLTNKTLTSPVINTQLTGTATGGTPSTQAMGDAATEGTATTVAKSDHKHAMPSLGGYVVAASRTAAQGAGTQSITGLGFPPQWAVFQAFVEDSDQASWGMAGKTSGIASFRKRGGGNYNDNGSGNVMLLSDGTNSMTAAFTSWDANGITVTWTKNGSGQNVTWFALFGKY